MFLITHSGSFHCDEVTSTAIFTLINKKCILLRTRNLEVMKLLIDNKIKGSEYEKFFENYKEFLATNKLAIYDVYGKYIPEKNVFDHHQREFSSTFYDDKFKYVKMSSAGLVFKHFGKELITAIIKDNKLLRKHIKIDDFINSTAYEELILDVYENYFLCIDANDNGVNHSEEEPVNPRYWPHVVNLYNISENFGKKSEYELSNISYEYKKSREFEDEVLEETKRKNASFNHAVEFARSDLELFLRKKIFTFGIEYSILLKEIEQAESLKNGKIIVWKETKKDFEVGMTDTEFKKKLQLKFFPDALFFIYPPPFENGQFRIYGASESLKTYKCKAYLKKEWRGIRDEKLKEISQLDKISFVHSSGFTGGAYNLETAIKMAEESIEDQ